MAKAAANAKRTSKTTARNRAANPPAPVVMPKSAKGATKAKSRGVEKKKKGMTALLS